LANGKSAIDLDIRHLLSAGGGAPNKIFSHPADAVHYVIYHYTHVAQYLNHVKCLITISDDLFRID